MTNGDVSLSLKIFDFRPKVTSLQLKDGLNHTKNFQSLCEKLMVKDGSVPLVDVLSDKMTP